MKIGLEFPRTRIHERGNHEDRGGHPLRDEHLTPHLEDIRKAIVEGKVVVPAVGLPAVPDHVADGLGGHELAVVLEPAEHRPKLQAVFRKDGVGVQAAKEPRRTAKHRGGCRQDRPAGCRARRRESRHRRRPGLGCRFGEDDGLFPFVRRVGNGTHQVIASVVRLR
jgi:hypothetical protein